MTQPSSREPAPWAWRRLSITLAALALFRLGGRIPMPGLDWDMLTRAGFPDDAMGRLSIFALGITPIFSVMLLLEAAKLVLPKLAGGAAARRGVLPAALLMAAFQGFGIAEAMNRIEGMAAEPGEGFIVGVALTLVGGTALTWRLGQAITRLGLGEGLWLLFASSPLSALPQAAANLAEMQGQGTAGSFTAFALIACVVLAAVLFILARGAGRPLASPGVAPGEIWPPFLAQSLAGLLVLVLQLWLSRAGVDAAQWLAPSGLAHDAAFVLFLLLAVAMIEPDASRPRWPMAAAQIVICLGVAALPPNWLSGPWLILCCAALTHAAAALRRPDRDRAWMLHCSEND